LHEKVTRRIAANFLRALIAAVPYRVHTVLTDNGTHFTEPSGNTWTPDEIKQMLARKECSGPTPSNSPAPRTMWSTA
jgi:hypothetical protein